MDGDLTIDPALEVWYGLLVDSEFEPDDDDYGIEELSLRPRAFRKEWIIRRGRDGKRG
jgi:hypothetical protein